MKLTYSAPAKIIITGEHSGVYGKPMLISALKERLSFTVEDAPVTKADKDIDLISKNVRHSLKKSGVEFDNKPYSYTISSDIPAKKNLGSSAALSVAASAALLHFYTGREFSKEVINQVAYMSEKHFHGNPSGGDNSTSCFGGFIYFRKEFEFLKNISSLNAKIPKNIMDRLFIIDSGNAVETTGEMVEKVGKFYNAHPTAAEQIMNSIEKITKRIVVSIVKEDPNMFVESLCENERLLEELGVVSEQTKKRIASLSDLGVAKVTGGGGFKEGSGNLLFFAIDPIAAEKEFKKKNITVTKFVQDFEGVRQEKKYN
ncbi:hypothetical protein HYS00_05510 [Candidatus Microgenomates bacterium]|nr:hypothetical protein [Candidatus Microgenomates bacterium]